MGFQPFPRRMNPEYVRSSSISICSRGYDSQAARSRKQALPDPMECQNRVGNPYRYWGQHLHTWPASYLVIAAVISACPLSRLFYDKGCTSPPRMKLRRSIAFPVYTLPSPPPIHRSIRHLFPRGWITTNRKVRRSERTEQRFYPWRTLRDKTPYCSSYRSVTPRESKGWNIRGGKKKKKKKSRS